MKEIREAIADGRFSEFKAQTEAMWAAGDIPVL